MDGTETKPLPRHRRNDLRLRFGGLLALALAPLLIFTIWQSYYDYRRDVSLREKVVDEAAETAVAQIVETVDTAKSVLRLTADLITPETCDATLTQVLDVFPRMYNMASADADGMIGCASFPIRTLTPRDRTLAALSPETPFVLTVLNFETEDQNTPQRALIIGHGNYDGDSLQNILFAGYDLSEVQNLKNKSILPPDVRVSIFSRSGEILLGSDSVEKPELRRWADLAERDTRLVMTQSDEDGTPRRLTILPTQEPELFLAVNAPKQSLLSWNRINPWASAIVPLFAWVFGFAAIWLALESLVLSRLRRIRMDVQGFARDKITPPPARKSVGNDTISSLGDSFRDMATRITERENDLKDSLEEKTNLLREIHHRVKNNLQVITSLLNMQQRQVSDPFYKQAIDDTRNRIIAISQVHKSLYESPTNEDVDLEPFILELTQRLGRALCFEDRGISVQADINAAAVCSDTATPMALFLVEAMTNAAKHGLRDGGTIFVSVEDANEGETTLRVRDNGVGRHAAAARKDKDSVPELSTATGIGEKLMQGFARQLGGSYHVDSSDQGYTCLIRFMRRSRDSSN